MATFGSGRSAFQAVALPVVDPNGNQVIDPTNGLGSSPLGLAAREQIFFGIPNGSFSNIPQSPLISIDDITNPLPYWSVTASQTMSATSSYDTTTKTWGVILNPGTAAANDYISMRTRAFVSNDDSLALRQKAFLTLSKNGTYSGSTQFKIELICQYFDANNTSVASATIGTALDNAAWTSIGGTTTTGGSAFPASAVWAEYEIKLTATASVTSGITATLQNLLVATSQPGAQSFVVSQVFTSSGNWVAPTGVTSVDIFAVGGGAGGAGGGVNIGGTAFNFGYTGSAGGGAGAAFMSRAVPVTPGSTYSIGIGTAGAGGVTGPTTKAAGATTTYNQAGAAGGAGGDTTFGSLIIAKGGSSSSGGWNRAGNKFAFDSTIYQTPDGGGGGQALAGAVDGTAGASMSYIGLTSASPITVGVFPYSAPTPGVGGLPGTGSVTSTGTATLALISGGTAGGAAGYCGSGGGSPGRTAAGANGVGANGGYGGGGAAAGRLSWTAMGTAQTLTISGPNGGSASANSGGGGGGGGFLVITSANNTTVYNNSAITWTSGAGGSGSTGCLVVAWTA